MFSFKGCSWATRKTVCFPFATDPTNWPGETCAFLNMTECAWKRKAFEMTWNRQRKNGRKVAGRKAVAWAESVKSPDLTSSNRVNGDWLFRVIPRHCGVRPVGAQKELILSEMGCSPGKLLAKDVVDTRSFHGLKANWKGDCLGLSAKQKSCSRPTSPLNQKYLENRKT